MSVNTKGGVRAHILECLRNVPSPVSGETMAESLGVSRVAVWKAIRTLNESGYAISATPTGYRLERDRTDGVFPWEFSSDETGFRYMAETASTMDLAREEALSGCEDGLIVLADRQTDGRGTGDRRWKSFDGSLFFTMVTRPSIPPGYSHRETLRAQLAMADAIEAVTHQRAEPHWPNDIYLPNGKACGILTETMSVGSSISYLNLGIGANTAEDVDAAGDTASGGERVDAAFIASGRQELLKAFRAQFRKSSATAGETGAEAELAVGALGFGDDLARAWNARGALVGKTVRIRIGACRDADSRVEEATFAGVDQAGWAIMQGQSERHFPPGSITILDKGTRT